MFSLKILTPKTSPVARLGKEGPEIIKNTLTEHMMIAEAAAKNNVTGGGKSRERLNVRSGRLRNSIAVKVKSKGNQYVGIIGTKLIYARIHEEGGEIRPVKGRYLTIPMRLSTKSGKGVTRYSSVTKRGNARWTAGDLALGGTFIMKSKSGNLFIWGKTGKDKIVPLFLLKEKVEIPERPYLMPALETIKPRVVREIEERMVETVETVKHGV